MTFDPAALAAPFPPEAIHWRAQSVSKKNPDAPKAMALAYIDARDVMARLDEVCGPANWQDSYTETAKGRLLCTLSIRIDGEWIGKSDGAGNTDVEGDKGAISDSLKRAAVKWGIGRYLYDMPTPWVRCDLYNDKWSGWTTDGRAELDRIARNNSPQTKPAVINDSQWAELVALCEATSSDTKAMTEHYKVASLKDLTVPQFEHARATLRKRLPQPEQKAA